MAKAVPVLAKWKKNKRGQCPVYIRLADADAKVAYRSTGIMVTPRQWNENDRRVRKNVRNSDLHNAKIADMVAVAEKRRARMELDGAVATTHDLARALESNRPVRQTELPTILGEYEHFVDGKRARYRRSTILVYDALRGHLENWIRPDTRISEINAGTLTDFQTHLLEKGLGNVTVNKLATRLRGFFLWLEERGQINRVPKAERLPQPRNLALYLTLEELERLARLDLSDVAEGFAAARDLFVASALTGQRFSDLRAMRWEEVDLEDGWWRMPMQKKAVTLRVPLAAPVRQIIESRRGEKTPLPILSNQKANANIKEVAHLAGIDQAVTVQKLRGAERQTETRVKHELITMHCARRTFVTLALQEGTPVTVLLGLTHDDLRTLRLYAGTDERERAKHIDRVFGFIGNSDEDR